MLRYSTLWIAVLAMTLGWVAAWPFSSRSRAVRYRDLFAWTDEGWSWRIEQALAPLTGTRILGERRTLEAIAAERDEAEDRR